MAHKDFYGIRTPTSIPHEPFVLGGGGGVVFKTLKTQPSLRSQNKVRLETGRIGKIFDPVHTADTRWEFVCF